MKKNQSGEILLLVIVLILLGGYAVFHYILTPLKAQINSMNDMILQKELDIKTKYITVSTYPDRCEQLKTLLEKTKEAGSRFYSGEIEDTFLEHIRRNIKESQVDFVSLTAADGTLKIQSLGEDSESGKKIFRSLTEEGDPEAFSQTEADFLAFFESIQASGGRLETDVKTTEITVEVSGDYSEVLMFLKGITGADRNIICNSLTLEIPDNISLKAADDPFVRASAGLIFPDIPGIAKITESSEPEALSAYSIPQEILDGSYRKEQSFFSKIAGKFGIR